ncbi:threonyl-tRNA synthetase [Campylobacter jejuni subsp. jejuni ICDCCJ07001]|nr:threonyl-tRNA synthetase [Campylobacter jejuni subsp. jejuni ICDCCJ07001]
MEKEVIAYLDNETIIDSQSVKNTNLKEIYFDNSKESLEVIRHSCAHLMAQAIKSLYPEAKFFVGPVIEDGFYYDFRVESKIGEEDLVKIEKKMKELAEAKIEILKYEITKNEALAKFQNDDLKQEVLLRILMEL